MSKERPTFLLTNDDGIDSVGLAIVEEFFSKFADVFVFAPATHQSAMSTSISINKKEGLTVEKINDFRYAVHGTPADCVAFALTNLPTKIDVVISGCNRGFNISTDTIYSGTVGACHQAHMFGYPSIALSADVSFKNLQEKLDYIYTFLTKNNLISSEYILNINIPPTDKINGIKITKLASMKQDVAYKNNYEVFFYNGRKCVYNNKENNDYMAMKRGYISITPLKSTTFYDGAYRKLKKLNNN